jgi:hypothetical protein
MYLQFYAPATKNIITSSKWKKVKLRLCLSTFEKNRNFNKFQNFQKYFSERNKRGSFQPTSLEFSRINIQHSYCVIIKQIYLFPKNDEWLSWAYVRISELISCLLNVLFHIFVHSLTKKDLYSNAAFLKKIDYLGHWRIHSMKVKKFKHTVPFLPFSVCYNKIQKINVILRNTFFTIS